MPQLLTQPAFLLATALIPDRASPYEYHRRYGLVRVGTCYSVLLFKNPVLARKNALRLQDLPVEFLQKRQFPREAGGENEHGWMYYHQRRSALAWFIDYFIRRGDGVLTLEGEDRARANNPFRAAIATAYQEHQRPPHEGELLGIVFDTDANQDDRFLMALDIFALRQITQFEARNEPPVRAFFEEEVRTLIGVCVDEDWIPDGLFERTVATSTPRQISILQQTRGQAVLDRAEHLVNELLAIIEPSTITHS
jgi:hypothetical protein